MYTCALLTGTIKTSLVHLDPQVETSCSIGGYSWLGCDLCVYVVSGKMYLTLSDINCNDNLFFEMI